MLIIARIMADEEPVPEPMAVKLAEGPTVAEMAGRYLEEHVAVRCKPKMASMYRLVVEKYIVPRLRRRPALAVGNKEVTELYHAAACGLLLRSAPARGSAQQRRQRSASRNRITPPSEKIRLGSKSEITFLRMTAAKLIGSRQSWIMPRVALSSVWKRDILSPNLHPIPTTYTTFASKT